MSAQKLTLPSPAKLNLMLHILGRREDGYHELQTLFQFLDYGDEMTFADGGALTTQIKADLLQARTFFEHHPVSI